MVWIGMLPIGSYVFNNDYKLVELLEKDQECDTLLQEVCYWG